MCRFIMMICALMLLGSCKSRTFSHEGSPELSTSKLQALHDEDYSLILRRSSAGQYAFFSCLGYLTTLSLPSCTPALTSQDGEMINYDFAQGEVITPAVLEQIHDLGWNLAKDVQASEEEIMQELAVTPVGILAPLSINVVKKIRDYQQVGRLLNAKLLFANLMQQRPASSFLSFADEMMIQNEFYLPGNVEKLERQAKIRWSVLIKEAATRVSAGKSITLKLAELQAFIASVQFRQASHFSQEFQRSLKELSDLASHEKRFRGEMLSSAYHPHYNQHLKKAQEIKSLALSGEYDKAYNTWREWKKTKSPWTLRWEDDVVLARDLSPHKTHPLRLARLQERFRRLHGLGLVLLKEKKNLTQVISELENVLQSLDDFPVLEEPFSSSTTWQMYSDLKKRGLDQGLLPKQGLQQRPTGVSKVRWPKKGVVKLSGRGKVSSFASKGAKSFSGWAVSLLAGVVVVFAVVDRINRKTFTEISDNHTQESQTVISSIPFAPVSFYGDHWPALTSLDPKVSLAVPSVPSVIKTLALHASYGDVELAAQMQMCLPTKQDSSASSIAPTCKKVVYH